MWLLMELAYCLHSTRRITFSVWSGRASPWHRNVVATLSECCLDDPAARILGSVENPIVICSSVWGIPDGDLSP